MSHNVENTNIINIDDNYNTYETNINDIKEIINKIITEINEKSHKTDEKETLKENENEIMEKNNNKIINNLTIVSEYLDKINVNTYTNDKELLMNLINSFNTTFNNNNDDIHLSNTYKYLLCIYDTNKLIKLLQNNDYNIKQINEYIISLNDNYDFLLNTNINDVCKNNNTNCINKLNNVDFIDNLNIIINNNDNTNDTTSDNTGVIAVDTDGIAVDTGGIVVDTGDIAVDTSDDTISLSSSSSSSSIEYYDAVETLIKLIEKINILLVPYKNLFIKYKLILEKNNVENKYDIEYYNFLKFYQLFFQDFNDMRDINNEIEKIEQNKNKLEIDKNNNTENNNHLVDELELIKIQLEIFKKSYTTIINKLENTAVITTDIDLYKIKCKLIDIQKNIQIFINTYNNIVYDNKKIKIEIINNNNDKIRDVFNNTKNIINQLVLYFNKFNDSLMEIDFKKYSKEDINKINNDNDDNDDINNNKDNDDNEDNEDNGDNEDNDDEYIRNNEYLNKNNIYLITNSLKFNYINSPLYFKHFFNRSNLNYLDNLTSPIKIMI